MSEFKNIVIFSFLLPAFVYGQTITWTLQTNPSLPQGVELYKGTRSSPILQAWYLDIDMNQSDLAIRPYIRSSSATVPLFCQQVGAYAAVNGGYFGGSTSYSSVIYPGEVKAVNVQSVTRNNQSYPVIRSLFSMDTTFAFSVDWIYHFDMTPGGLYTFSQPLPYTYNDPNPLPPPLQGDGTLYDDVLVGIGGAPTLVKDSTVHITYNEEIMWGSGVGFDNNDPRTAAGYTRDNHVILFVADGRQTISEGLGLPEMAQVMLSLGCIEGMNLDGGGSTQMATPGNFINSPSEQRAVPTILAVVHRDSLGVPAQPLIEKIIDTEDPGCSLIGSGWFASANPGYWGGTPAQLNPVGSAQDYAKFTPNFSTPGRYEVYAWWVAASNRCPNTPFIIDHNYTVDTIRVDQTANGSTWFYLGEYIFAGDTSESVIISDSSNMGTYIVADAMKFVAYDTGTVIGIPNVGYSNPTRYLLKQNYPNPFNPKTNIEFSIPKTEFVTLKVYSLLGEEVTTLVSERLTAGSYKYDWDAGSLASGVYLYRIQSGNYVQTRKMILLR